MLDTPHIQLQPRLRPLLLCIPHMTCRCMSCRRRRRRRHSRTNDSGRPASSRNRVEKASSRKHGCRPATSPRSGALLTSSSCGTVSLPPPRLANITSRPYTARELGQSPI